MIRLIATDLDGTLLDDNKNIHPSFWEIHRELSQKGVKFIAASGRQYYTLKKQFDPVLDQIILLAENGTFVKHGSEELFVNSMPLEDARFFLQKARKVPNADVIFCGKNSAYVESDNSSFWKDAVQYYERIERVDDLLEVEDTVLKVTLWDHGSAEENSYRYFREYEGQFKVAVAGDVWLDITHKNASKGIAIARIQQMYGISPRETLVFGDYLNDLDMMGAGYYSYAMKNAHPRIAELSRFKTRFDNNNNGVVETIRELFGI